MCGLTGLWTRSGLREEELASITRNMARTITHRGPDDEGCWTDPEQGVAFGFRRLAIIDLSPRGHQPMESPNGAFMLVFNGEVYNHEELRSELHSLGFSFNGHSDTEVILAAFEAWGIEAAVKRFIGMFAMAVWDRRSRSLWLLRDRLGIKPLYIYHSRGTVAVASELKSLAVLPQFDDDIDRNAAAEYFRFLYVPAPRSIFSAVSKLPPGHLMQIRDPGGPLPEPYPYWSVRQVAADGLGSQLALEDAPLVDTAEAVISDAVALRLRADVPVGAFLSGGVDSAAVVAMMQEQSSRPVRTFTIGFDSPEHDETEAAAEIARRLGTTHHTFRLSGDDALSLIDSLPEIFDEPLADPSQLPTLLVCQAAREQVVVALSGDGGDEVFGGYNRYLYGEQVIRRAASLPSSLRRVLGVAAQVPSTRTWDALGRVAGGSHRLFGEKVHKLARVLAQQEAGAMYRSLVSAWQVPPVVGYEDDSSWSDAFRDSPEAPLLARMMRVDQESYLPDDLLAKVDRCSMAHSLEVRVPLLDHRVVEFGWRIPAHAKFRDGRGKWILRQLLYRRLPADLVDGPKIGFSVPLAEWLRGPLRPWAEELLSPTSLRDVGWLDERRIRALWSGFISGKHDAHLAVWTVLVFQMWRNHWLKPTRGSEPSSRYAGIG